MPNAQLHEVTSIGKIKVYHDLEFNLYLYCIFILSRRHYRFLRNAGRHNPSIGRYAHNGLAQESAHPTRLRAIHRRQGRSVRRKDGVPEELHSGDGSQVSQEVRGIRGEAIVALNPTMVVELAFGFSMIVCK